MPITTNSNIAAMSALRRLGTNTDVLRRSFERLSSGLRIVRASDDAAGLAVGTSLKVDSRVYTTGIRNLNDGLSALQIADGAIEQLSGIIIRSSELATQSANGTLSNTQRRSLDKEAQALRREYNRIVATAEFNGIPLISGALMSTTLQVGYGADGELPLNAGGEIQRQVGDGTFQAFSSYTGAGVAANVAAGDLNNDGRMDIVSGIGTLFAISLGNGDGSLLARTVFSGENFSNFRIDDLNDDGHLDIHGASLLGVYHVKLGNGNGTFNATVSYAASGMNISRSEASDVNGDGNLDIIHLGPGGGSNSFDVLLGNGNGTFRAPQNFGNAGYNTDFGTADFNGDGKLDVFGSYSGGRGLYLGNGDGTFRQPAAPIIGGGNTTNLEVGDINGDGNFDAVSQYGSAVTVAMGNGNGTFSIKNHTLNANPSAFKLGDINGDGLLDLVSTVYTGAAAMISIGNSDGSFAASLSFATAAANSRGVAIADLDQDGGEDLIVGTNGSSPLSILLANTQGSSTLEAFSLSSRTSAKLALTILAGARVRVSQERGSLGSQMMRIETAINSATILRENIEQAASQIYDIDTATESAKLVNGNILQEASAAILAQANQQPSLVLQLLSTR